MSLGSEREGRSPTAARWALVLGPALLALGVMWPRLASPQLGLLDDGHSMLIARRVAAGDLALPFTFLSEYGRFIPAYWFYFAPQFALWGDRPLGYFVVSWLSLAVVATAIALAVARRQGSPRAGLLAAVFLLASPPVIENYYTLGKGESQIALHAALTLWALALWLGARSRLWGLALIPPIVLLLLTKETGIVLLPIAVAWALLAAWDTHRNEAPSQPVRRLAAFAGLTCVLALLVRLAGWWIAPAPPGVSYVGAYTFSPGVLLNSAVGLGLLVVRDFGALLPLACAVWLVRRRLGPWPKSVLLAGLTWAGLWTAVFLPWRYSTQEYYLLPAALGWCVVQGVLADTLLGARRAAGLVRWAGLAAAAAFLLCNVANMRANGQLQIAMDAENAKLVELLRSSTPPNGSVLVALPPGHEYVFELGVFLHELRGRRDVQVVPLSTETWVRARGTPLVAVLRARGLPAPSVRWPAGSSLTVPSSKRRPQAHRSRQQTEGELLRPHAWACRAVALSETLASLPASRLLCPDAGWRQPFRFAFGWDVTTLGPSAGQGVVGTFDPAAGEWTLERVTRLSSGWHDGQPLAGNWSGAGMPGLAVYSAALGAVAFDDQADGRVDRTEHIPGLRPSDRAVAGDFDGDGRTDVGFFRPEDVSWRLSPALTAVPVRFGMPGDIPLAGDWNGDGRAGIGIYRPETGQLVAVDDVREPGRVRYANLERGCQPIVASRTGRGVVAVGTACHGHWRLVPWDASRPSGLQPAALLPPWEFDLPGPLPVFVEYPAAR